MSAEIYKPSDNAIRTMDRDLLRDFGRLKLANFDEIHVIREVTEVYRKQTEKAKKQYRRVGLDAFLIAWLLCGEDRRKGVTAASGIVTYEWVEALLRDVNPVTKYSFEKEADRKAQRLIEALTVTQNRDAEIDAAARAWSKQVGQYAIDITDSAVIEAYEEADVPEVMWMTERDGRVCGWCNDMDGQVFRLSDVPHKPHVNCRCWTVPVLK